MVFITTIFLGAAMPGLISSILSRDPTNKDENISLLEEEKIK